MFLGCLRAVYYAIKEPIFIEKFCVRLGPGLFLLVSILDLNLHGQVFAVTNVGNFVWDVFYCWFLYMAHLKNVLGSRFCLPVCKQHFIILSPVLMALFEFTLGLNGWIPPGEILPPALWFVWLLIQREIHAVNTNSLFAEFLNVFLNHFFVTVADDTGFGLGWCSFILHSEVALLPCI